MNVLYFETWDHHKHFKFLGYFSYKRAVFITTLLTFYWSVVWLRIVQNVEFLQILCTFPSLFGVIILFERWLILEPLDQMNLLLINSLSPKFRFLRNFVGIKFWISDFIRFGICLNSFFGFWGFGNYAIYGFVYSVRKFSRADFVVIV